MVHDPCTPIHDLATLPRKSIFFANAFAQKTRFRSWLSGKGAHLRAQPVFDLSVVRKRWDDGTTTIKRAKASIIQPSQD
jgi:hypothetical protein